MADYDYIVVGGGSAGCVTASRLVGDHGARVLLLEAGPAKGSPILAMPAGYMKFLASDAYLTMHQAVPQRQLDGRAPIIPQARLLGGGSAVNAMVYMRGQAADYDGWDRYLGQGSGWSYTDLLPHFKKQEDNDHLADGYHGVGGPLKVSHLGHHCTMSRAFVKTMQGLGVPYNPDFNGAAQGGVGFMQHTIDPVTRRRCSARDAITPKLLMLSGIGPAAQLKAFGIDVRVDLKGVGRNLQDHHEVPVVAAANGRYGYFRQDRGLAMLRNGLQYLLFKSGPVVTTGVEACAFIDPQGSGREGAIQLYCVPTVYLDRDVNELRPTEGVTLTPCVTRPRSRGAVTLRSADPRDPPMIDPNFFGEPDDLKLQMVGVRFARKVMRTMPMKDMLTAEIYPGADKQSDRDLERHCKRNVKTNYHPVGTCRMGPDRDDMAVLDDKLRVRGVDGLRVFDVSMMPALVSGNTNAPALAIADRAVTLMMG